MAEPAINELSDLEKELTKQATSGEGDFKLIRMLLEKMSSKAEKQVIYTSYPSNNTGDNLGGLERSTNGD